MSERPPRRGPLAGLLESGAVRRFDDWADVHLDALRGVPFADRVASAASTLGDWSLIWHLTGALRGLTSERAARQAIELSALLGLESLIVNQGIKRLFRRERPLPAGDPRYAQRTPSTSSFPSGHASAAFFAARILSGYSPRGAVAWYSLAVIVAASRPFVRIHHASDAVAGALVGAALAGLAQRAGRAAE